MRQQLCTGDATIISPTIAYVNGGLLEATRKQFQDGLVNANKKDRGQTLLSAFKLSGFEMPPPDFAKVMADTLQVFPIPDSGK